MASLEKAIYTIPCEYSYNGQGFQVNVVLTIPFSDQFPRGIPVSNADTFDTLADYVQTFLANNGFTGFMTGTPIFKEVETIDRIT